MSRMGPASRAAAGLGAAQVAGQVIGLLMMLVLARRLGLVGFGEYALASAVLYLANVGTTFGTDMVLVREIAASRTVARAAAATLLQLGLSLLAMGVIIAVAPLLSGGRHDLTAALRIVAPALLPAALYAVGTAVLRGAGMMRTYAAAGIASVAVPALAVVALVPSGAGVTRAVVVLVVAQTVIATAVWAMCVARVRGMHALPRASVGEVRAMLRDSTPVGALGLLGIAYQRLPVIALALAAGPAATGWFTAASRTVEASKTAHVGLYSAVYPSLAARHAASSHEHRSVADAARRDLRLSWRISAGLGVAVTAALLLLGPPVVERLFGAGFQPAATATRILAVAVIPSTLATYRSLELLAAHREATTLRVLGAGLLLLAAAMAILVPALGWIGACWAVLIAETAQAALMLTARTQPRAATAPSAAAALPSLMSSTST